MEPLSCTVHVRKDSCEVWAGSQVQGRARATAAEVTGLPLEKVVVHNYLLGGGFGRRLEHDYVTQAVRIAKQVEGPVKIVWTREEDVQHDVYRPYYYDRIAAGLDARASWSPGLTGSSGSRSSPAGHLPRSRTGWMAMRWTGRCNCSTTSRPSRSSTSRHEEPVLRTGWWRGVGVTHNSFVVESFIDELAAAARQDPVAFRRGAARASRRGPGRCSTWRPRRPGGESRSRPATDAAWR